MCNVNFIMMIGKATGFSQFMIVMKTFMEDPGLTTQLKFYKFIKN